MSASRIILASLHPFAKSYQNWCKFDEVLTKTNLHNFLRHSVVCQVSRSKVSSFENFCPDTQTHTQCALPGPLKWTLKTIKLCLI